MISRHPFYLLLACLYLLGLSAMVYRHWAMEIPWLPGQQRDLWSIEAKVTFTSDGAEVLASLAIPKDQIGFTRISHTAASPGYGLNFVSRRDGERVEWSIRQAEGTQILYYRADMLVEMTPSPPRVIAPDIVPPLLAEPLSTAANQLVSTARKHSAEPLSLTRELLKQLHLDNQNAQLLLRDKALEQRLVQLLALANVPARVVYTLRLEDGRRRQKLQPYVMVFSDDGYQVFVPYQLNDNELDNAPRLLWESAGQPVLELTGGTDSEVVFSTLHESLPAQRAALQKFSDEPSLLLSLHKIPLEEQALFKGMLLLPVGVLVVVFMRIIIGLHTSGTFMPVLIATAFIQTSLLTGLIGFLMVVGAGLLIRAYLSRLNLLLVARISAVIITVITIIALFSIIAFNLGISEGLKITLFPIVILSWTVERMSLLWEEEGAREVLIQGGGSLLVAVLAYLAMDNDLVRHLTFNFLGLQAVLLATIMLLGSYTGYRLLELRRFAPLLEDREQR
jgi:hypothetical protein